MSPRPGAASILTQQAMGSPALSIKLRCTSWHQLSVIYKRDLARNTLFLKTHAPPEVGTVVRIDLTLPSETTVSMIGEVSAHVPASDSRGAGIDVRLAPLPPNSLWLIESALAAASKLRGDSSAEAAVAPLADRHEVGSAESELVAALHAEIDSLRRLNPFQILGLGYEAGDAEVRAAFAELTKRYHPDRFTRYQSAEPRRLAAEIFILIRDAYRKLGDAQSRTTALQSIGRSGEPRIIPVMRPPQVPLMRPGSTSGPTPRASTSLVVGSAPLGEPAPKGPELAAPAAVARTAGSGAFPGEPQRVHPRPSSGSGAALPPPAPRGSAGSSASQRPLAPPARSSAPAMTSPGHAVTEAELEHIERLLDEDAYDEAFASYKSLAKRAPTDRHVRAGLELCEGLMALAAKERLEAAQHFETVLEIDPSNERAARQLADMRRQATNERRGLLSRLMGKKE